MAPRCLRGAQDSAAIAGMNRSRFVLALCASSLPCLAASGPATSAAADWPIVVRHGDRLEEGGRPFRFFGLTTPNLQAHESQLRPDFSNRFPDEYETRDALDTLHRLGARATRTFSLSIASPADGKVPAYVSARRTYNEEAFRCLDRVLALCHEYDVRLIIPVIASQSFGGIRGVDEFAALAGNTQVGAFWTDEAVKADYRHLLAFLVSRRNTVSGVLYRDDPAILAWQFGNEFDVFVVDRKLPRGEWQPKITAWCVEMAHYLKQIDPNHLVMDAGADRATMIACPDVDVISTHLYEYWNRLSGAPTDLAAIAHAHWLQCRGKKPLLIDEFGLATVDHVRALMRTIREDGITGGLLWSLRVHRRDGGFFYHNEGGTPINSYHYPGFASGADYHEMQLFDLVRTEAFAIRGMTPPPITAPAPAPVLLRTDDGFTWRGATGASRYAIERAESPEGPWTVLADSLADSVMTSGKLVADFESRGEWRPVTLWTDESAAPGETHFYRIRGFNAAGATAYSDVLQVAR